MAADAESLVSTENPPKRRMRNFLLDPRFQLKYTGMVVLVTVVVAAVLGYFAYDYSKGQTEALTVTIAMYPDTNPEVAADLEGYAKQRDQIVLLSIVGGILVLAVALGLTGIVVTHKVVGPAYKLQRLVRDVAEGRLKVQGRLRKGDELQEVFEAYAGMVEALRARQTGEIAKLDAAIDAVEASGASEEALNPLRELRDEMQSALE